MQIGQAYYCSHCGVEIVTGDACEECDPENGTQQVSFWFVGVHTSDDEETIEEQSPRWMFWRR